MVVVCTGMLVMEVVRSGGVDSTGIPDGSWKEDQQDLLMTFIQGDKENTQSFMLSNRKNEVVVCRDGKACRRNRWGYK